MTDDQYRAKERKRRDKNFKLICEWMSKAQDVAEAIEEELEAVKRITKATREECDDDMIGIRNALTLLSFLPALYEAPQAYEGGPEEQRDLYRECAYGLMKIAQMVGYVKQDEDCKDYNIFGY